MNEPTRSIGTARMQPDGTIVLWLRARSDTGAVGEAMLEYAPEDPRYAEILEHVGPLEPGGETEVAPWPESD